MLYHPLRATCYAHPVFLDVVTSVILVINNSYGALLCHIPEHCNGEIYRLFSLAMASCILHEGTEIRGKVLQPERLATVYTAQDIL